MNPEASPNNEMRQIVSLEESTKESTNDNEKKQLVKGEEAKRGNSDLENVEERLNSTSESFDELLDAVKNAPEAKRVAMEAFINDMKKQAEQMSKVRDMKNFNELKRVMIKQWKELQAAAADDPETLKSINNWGNEFIESKVVFHDLIGEVRDDLGEMAEKVQSNYSDLKQLSGEVRALLENEEARETFLLDLENIWDKWQEQSPVKEDDDEQAISPVKWRVRGSYRELIRSLTHPDQGFSEKDLDVNEASRFVKQLQDFVENASSSANRKTTKFKDGRSIDVIPVQENPRIRDVINEMKEKIAEISKIIKESNKIFKIAKKTRDTHFLPLYNTQGPESENKKSVN